MTYRKTIAALPAILLPMTALAVAADPEINILKSSGSLERLLKKSGVYHASSTGKTPNFVIDPSWPPPLPNNYSHFQAHNLRPRPPGRQAKFPPTGPWSRAAPAGWYRATGMRLNV
jgi:hypothetical protein